MSDTGRKDQYEIYIQYPYCVRNTNFFSAEAKEEITPDFSKSTQGKVKQTVTDITDRAARGFQSDDDKSAPRQAFDKTQRTHDNEAHGGATSSIGDKVKGALSMNN